jgi:hypothetical protein
MADTHPFTAKPAPNKPVVAVVETAEERINKKINTQIIEDAVQNREQIINDTENHYSKELQALENRYSHDSPVMAEKLEVKTIDPARFVASQALGMTKPQSLGHELPEKMIETVPQAHLDATLQHFTEDTGAYSFGVNVQSGSRFCFIMPVSEVSLALTTGLTGREKETYVNSHEAWHCLDDKQDGLLNAKQNLRAAQSGSVRDHALILQKFEQVTIETQKEEAFADMGAIGDMIRANHSPSVLDRVIASRASKPEAADHYTPATLEALKNTIEDMGIDKFKSLHKNELKDLYHSLAEKHSLTPEKVRELQNQNAVVSKKVEQHLIGDSINNWDYKGELQKKALAVGFEISPASLLKAYSLRQDELRSEIQLHPESEALVTNKMAHLAANIKDMVQTTDYVAVNKEHGVKFTMASGMSKFMKPPEEAAKPDSHSTPHPARTSSNASLIHSL